MEYGLGPGGFAAVLGPSGARLLAGPSLFTPIGDNAVTDRDDTPTMTAEVAAALTIPVLGAVAIAVVLLLVVAADSVGRLVTIIHEGGHMVIGFLTGHKIKYFHLYPDREGGETQYESWRWGPGRMLTAFAGYVAPPLVGLGGALLLKEGKAWPLLWAAVILLILAWVKARDELTTFVVLLLAGATAYVGLYGPPVLQAAFAAGLVLLLLFGGLRSALVSSTDRNKSDAGRLSRDTLIPAVVWKAAFVTIALFCAWKGVSVLAA